MRLFDRSYPRVRERLARDLAGRASVIEVASGTGQFTLDLAGVAEAVTATDISPAMVERLGDVVAASGVADRVTVAVMSAYVLAAEDGAFDGLFCANALHVMDDPRRALGEMRRVLAPGGALVAPTFLHGTGFARRSLSRVMSLVSPFVARERFDLDGLSALIAEAGFEVQRAERLPGLFPLGYVVAARRP